MTAPKELAAAIFQALAEYVEEHGPIPVSVIPKEIEDPEANWCEGSNRDGSRCSHNAARDGLCTPHWRKAEAARILAEEKAAEAASEGEGDR